MSVAITVINNEGTQMYTKSLNFDVAGRNKHVVEMNSQWPNGLYHAILQYTDGSSESVTFNVEY